ncbi:MAG: 16S rRNA (guanine(527)-N(7))-methyltransferase RsmG [Paracoccaceae bacterium]|nr:16S rRNA (guanine(527)-N(7))-methyltransferase RsmG [Paracoccaceae bacterium]
MILSDLDVSRETLGRLEHYQLLIEKWNPTINLISKSSIRHLWDRHIWDSAQIYRYAGERPNWMDIGSGGGLPGVVVAILAKQGDPQRHVTMVESDVRKSVFLKTVIRELDLPASVVVGRIEKIAPADCDILTARALADLHQLLHFVDRHLKPSGRAIFLKGESWEEEVAAARKAWSFDLRIHKSITNPKAAILEVKDIQVA